MVIYYHAADKSGTVSVFIDIWFLLSWIRLKQKKCKQSGRCRPPSRINPTSNAHDHDDTYLLPPGLLNLLCPKLEGIANLLQSWWKHAHTLVQKKKKKIVLMQMATSWPRNAATRQTLYELHSLYMRNLANQAGWTSVGF